MVFAAISCSTESGSEVEPQKKSAASQSAWGDYNISLEVSENGSLWTYTISKTTNKSKALSHFILNLQNCGDESVSFGNIIYATVNGQPAVLKQSEGQGTNCNPQAITSNFVKFDDLTDATSWTMVLKFDRGYAQTSTTGWIKAGNSCNSGAVPGPGYPIEEYCSFSQGFFFANGALNNGASEFWASGLTIGGVTYTQAQGMQAWDVDRGPGGDQTMNGFFQLGAVRLSGVDSEVAADANLIDTYFTGLDIFSLLVVGGNNQNATYFNLPAENNGVTSNQVKAAGGRIGSFVDANHCP